MANYMTKMCSNYFRVTDEEKFKQLVTWYGGDVFEVVEHWEEKGLYSVAGDSFEGQGLEHWEEFEYVLEAEEEFEGRDLTEAEIEKMKKKMGVDADGYCKVSLIDNIAELLVDGEVAIFYEIGNEKLRYLTGYAVAVNNKGERREVSLYSIEEIAKELKAA